MFRQDFFLVALCSIKKQVMNFKELLQTFPSMRVIKNKLLIATANELRMLKEKELEDCRMYIIVCQGHMKIKLNDTTKDVKENSMLDLVESIRIRIEETSNDLRAYCMAMSYEFMSESLKSLKPFPETYLLDIIKPQVINFTEDECKTMERLVELIEDTLRNQKNYFREELCRTYFKSFVMEFGNIRLTKEENRKDKQNFMDKHEMLTVDFMRMIRQHAKKEHNVDFYAEELCISPKHLCRIVKKVLGKTPHEFINHELLQAASSMLEDNSISIQQIAASLGFSDQAAFCKFFKRHMKIPPVEYRKQIV